MTTATRKFQPARGVEALLNLVYEVKFSRHVPLTVILLSGVWAIYRSAHWFTAEFHLPSFIAWPGSVFVELLVLAASALTFISFRAAYVAELRKEDTRMAQAGAYVALTFLGVSLAALLSIAWSDAWLMTGAVTPAAIMTLVQLGQSGMIGIFVINALLEERAALRIEHQSYQRGLCQWCEQPISANNRARHMASCPSRPQP